MQRTITIGQISVTVPDPPANTAQIACGDVRVEVGTAAGSRFFGELTKIQEALVTARRVLITHALMAKQTGPASPDEMHLMQLLVDLELIVQRDEID